MAASPRSLISDPGTIRPVQLDQVEHLLKLQKWAQKITSILDLDELITKIVDDVAAAFCCVETTIYLHDEERGELEMAGVHGCTLRESRGSRIRTSWARKAWWVKAWWVTSRPRGRCVTRRMCEKIPITSPAKKPRSPKSQFR